MNIINIVRGTYDRPQAELAENRRTDMKYNDYETLLNDIEAEAIATLDSAIRRGANFRCLAELEERYNGMFEGARKAYLLFVTGDEAIDEAFTLCRQYKIQMANAYQTALNNIQK